MHDASRYIDDLLTVKFPEVQEVMYRARGEVDRQGTTGGPLAGICPKIFPTVAQNNRALSWNGYSRRVHQLRRSWER